ncbi:MAG: sulfotransferase [Microcoleaceae cyanobacterium MO_207.B10]|nr:sulfotransferase [Microcoleaceae cyanobacterium MO_207.B10]
MKVINNNNPLFALVCGFEHSGTTLVSEILRQHPHLDSGFEGGFLLNNEAKEFLTTEPFYTTSKKGWGLKDEDLSYICDADNWAEVYLRIRERAEVIKNKNALLFDKTPRYMQKLPHVLERVPDIPCIVIVKDIRSVFWSSYKRTKMTIDEWYKKIFKRTCNHTLSYARSCKKAIEKGLEERILLIRYEELCLDQKTQVKKIFNFLGLEFQESYLTFNHPKYKNVYGGKISTQYLTEYKGSLPEYICEEILELTSEYSDWLWFEKQIVKSEDNLLPIQESFQIKLSSYSEEKIQKQKNVILLPNVLNLSNLRVSLQEIQTIHKTYWKPGYGSISAKEAMFLQEGIEKNKPQKFLELGTASGLSTGFIAMFMNKNNNNTELFTIDLDETFWADRNQKTGFLAEKICPNGNININYFRNMNSTQIPNLFEEQKIDMAFIDANHQHPWPTLDMMSILPFMNKGSLVYHHDLALYKHQAPIFGIGPKYLFDQIPVNLRIVTPEAEGNIYYVITPDNYLELTQSLIDSLYLPWTIRSKISEVTLEGFRSIAKKFWGNDLLLELEKAIKKFNY